MADLQDITTRLGAAYTKWKGGEKEKNQAKDEFWAAIETDAAENPEEKLIEIEPGHLTDIGIEDYVEMYHPAWKLDEYRERDNEWVDAILTLKPEFKAFKFVNAADGMVYQRQFVNGSPVLNEDALQEYDPDLWFAITRIPNQEEVENLLYHANVEPDELKSFIDGLWNGPRDLLPLDTLDPETLARVQAFIHPGTPSVKLPAPKKATAEDLEAIADDA